MADRPARSVTKSRDAEVIDYHFNITLNVTATLDEKRLRKLIDEELVKLKSAVAAKIR
jgi:hypothetical protein